MIYFLLLYLLILAAIAFYSFRKISTFSDFFIARKSGSYYSVTGSLVATILGGSAVIGSIDAGASMGWATAWYMLCAALGLLAVLPLLNKISTLGRFTLPELLEDIYGAKAKNFASLIIPVAWLGIIAAQIIAAAKILQSFLPVDYTLGVIITGFVFIGYTIAGGQISILKTDFVQSMLIVAGLILVGAFAFTHKEAYSVPTFDFPFNEQFKPFDLFILVITYSTTFTAGPDIYSRIFCAESKETARRSIITAAIILVPIAFVIGYLSVFGTGVAGIESGTGIRLTDIGVRVLPAWLLPLVVLSLLSAVLSSADTSMLSASIIITDFFEKNNFSLASIFKTRVVIVVIGALSILIALKFTSIIGVLLLALSVYAGAFVVPVILGLVGLKVRPLFVSIAIVSGGVLALAGKIMVARGLYLHGNGFIISAFLVNFLIMIIGRKRP